ncbi:hypothetical protein H6P81_016592 [Aristolochia fimbriata]|uniref:Uncharacterized protein n=1 Tax=Aristolochia fimbriata TaxID=158543 RepID=A0AAV7E8T0_ARIFI|nr:hypothetical protein H6P81_016592 [Aristolochia fimbriata]
MEEATETPLFCATTLRRRQHRGSSQAGGLRWTEKAPISTTQAHIVYANFLIFYGVCRSDSNNFAVVPCEKLPLSATSRLPDTAAKGIVGFCGAACPQIERPVAHQIEQA